MGKQWAELTAAEILANATDAMFATTTDAIGKYLADGQWRTVGEIMQATGRGRGSVANTLRTMDVETQTVKSGFNYVRIYRLPAAEPSTHSPKVSGGKRPIPAEPTGNGLACHPQMPGKCCGRPVRKGR